MGAFQYLEKPLSYDQVLVAARGARRATFRSRPDVAESAPAAGDATTATRLPPPALRHLRRSATRSGRCSRTSSSTAWGSSGGRTASSCSRSAGLRDPLPLDAVGLSIPARVEAVGDAGTHDAGRQRRLDQDGRAPAVGTPRGGRDQPADQGARRGFGPRRLGDQFCRTLEAIGLADQDEPRRSSSSRPQVRGRERREGLVLEPYDGFAISYLLRYPPPIGTQQFDFELTDFAAYEREIAPARTFGFMRDLKMMNELGLGSGGRLDNFILVGEDNVINTELRFPDEFVRHKILDVIGDLYLLGYPLRGRVTARLTGHRDNIAMVRKLVDENRLDA
ncbi:MAG: UDP-3-O-acyl-N-acetylglucosamine deacetylase [Thermoanaerobaculia bacterium]